VLVAVSEVEAEVVEVMKVEVVGVVEVEHVREDAEDVVERTPTASAISARRVGTLSGGLFRTRSTVAVVSFLSFLSSLLLLFFFFHSLVWVEMPVNEVHAVDGCATPEDEEADEVDEVDEAEGARTPLW
jgi:hypothetical protein